MTVIEKQCKHCGNIFQFNYEPDGKGSGNKLKRPYCTDECAVLHRKQMKLVHLPSRLTKICVECKTEFYVSRCHAGRNLCSNKCRYSHVSKLQTKHNEQTLTCRQCNLSFTTKNIKRVYCSSLCVTKAKSDKIERTCEVCHKTFSTKRSYIPRFCGKRCTSEAQSRGMIASHVNGRSGYRSDIVDSPYFKSSFEADYYRYCIQVLKKVPLYESRAFHVIVDGDEKCYTPDFWFKDENQFIELKGVREGESRFSKLLNSNTSAREAVILMGYRIDVIYMDHFYNTLREQGLYDTIPNLENRDYAGTKHLIRKHGQN